jgi:hypothetical protein
VNFFQSFGSMSVLISLTFPQFCPGINNTHEKYL